jgi:hypothetical protein
MSLQELMAHNLATKNKLDALTHVYSVMDSALCEQTVKVKAEQVEFTDAPAFSTSDAITLNTNVLNMELDDNSLVSLHGVNYHEVSHILYTPRAQQEMSRRVWEDNLQSAFNMLEDMRIETLLIGRYPSVRESLTKCVFEHVLGDEKTFDTAFILIRGRRYLPLDVRQSIADAFTAKYGIDATRQFAQVIDEYRELAFPDDTERGLFLVSEYQRLMNEYMPSQNENGEQGASECAGLKSDVCDHVNSRPPQSGRPASADKQREDLADADSDGDEPESLEPAEAGQAGGQSRESNDESNPESIKKQIENAIKEIMESAQVKNDVKSIRNAVRDQSGITPKSGRARFTLHQPSTDATFASKAFSRELERMQSERDSYWVQSDSGTVNVGRYMTADVHEMDNVFDEWTDAVPSLDLECVLLIDRSESMDNLMQTTCESAWAIKRGLEAINGRCHVYAFNHSSTIVATADEPASHQMPVVSPIGGTDPYEALIEAERILMASRRANKMMIVLSDGAWGGSNDAQHESVERMNGFGVNTASVFLTPAGSQPMPQGAMDYYKHRCLSLTVLENPRELLNVARALVKSM